MARERKPRKPKAAPAAAPTAVEYLTWATAIEEQPLSPLWKPWIDRGTVALIEGRKGTGKSTLAATIAGGVTGGCQLPGWAPTRSQAVIWDAGEDAWATVVRPRLRAVGAQISLVAAPNMRDTHQRPRRLSLPGDALCLEQAVMLSKAGLVVLDPYGSAVQGGIDLRSEQDVRAYLTPLVDIAARTQTCVLLTRNLRKGVGGDAREAGLGSVAVGNIARVIIRCDEHPHEPNRYVMSCVATNNGRKPASLVYEIESAEGNWPRIKWVGPCDLDADALAEGRGNEAERDEWAEADRLLYALIGEGWVDCVTVMSEAGRAGISERTLKRAKSRLKIPSKRVPESGGAHWEWGRPEGGWPAGLTT